MLLIWNPSTLTSSEIVIPDVSFSVAFSVGATVGNVVVVSSFDIVTFSETPALSTPFKTAFTVMVCSPAWDILQVIAWAESYVPYKTLSM